MTSKISHSTDEQHYLVHPKYRADIDGLRAIAVLSVVGFHAFPSWIKGGFVGVDVFFVISGFLISSIIFESLDKGTFSFHEFYARRIKRIFPALILVMLASYTLGWFALLADEYKQLGKHIAASAGFVSNFIFWQEAGYFDNSADTKPMLHLWSLGIEEQFYIIWPLLLYVAWEKRFNALSICIAIAITSFALNVIQVSGNAVAVFYSPLTRFWELLMGSFLAYISLHKITFGQNVIWRCNTLLGNIVPNTVTGNRVTFLRDFQSILGISLIGVAVLLLNKERLFPGWWALLPTVGAYLIISAGTKAWFNRKVLSHRLLVWVGLISFPLYLWHWPLLSFARIIGSETPSREVRIAAVLVSIVLAWLTYKLLEKPIRYGQYSKTKVFILCVMMFGVGFIGHNTDERNGLSFRLKGFESSLQEIKSVVESTDGCKSIIPVKSRYCLISDPSVPPTVALIGDSHSNRLYSSLYWRYQSIGENLLQLGGGGCLPFWDIETGSVGNPNNCAAQMRPQLDYVLGSESIKTVIFMHRGPVYIEGIDINSKNRIFIKDLLNPNDLDGKTIYAKALTETIKRFAHAKKRIILIIDAPEFDFDPMSCVDAIRPMSSIFKDRLDCRLIKQDVDKRNYAYIEITKLVAKSFDNVKIVNLQDALCDKDFCYGVKDGKLLYKDSDHLNPFGAEYVAKQLWKQFQ